MTQERRLEIAAMELCRLREELSIVRYRIEGTPVDADGVVLSPDLSALLEEQAALEDRIDRIESGSVVRPFSSPCSMVIEA